MEILRYIKRKKKPRVFKYIKKKRKGHALHFTLIDPDKQMPEKAGEIAERAKRFGTDAIMVGGSHPTQAIYLDECIKEIKKRVDLPVILFPSDHSGISAYADAVFFMSLLNSKSPQYLIEEQMKGSILVKNYRLEPLPMAYLIVDSGETTSAAWVGDVRPLPREKPEFAVGYALAAKYFGMRFVYLEAGSGAKYTIPNEMIKMVKESISPEMLLIVGGGIRDGKTAREKVNAGADIIVTGTLAETDEKKFREVIEAVRGKK
ncbi:MAG: geranylgeranylglyceryl/heptaprenylglyceryl phosphate synthase [Candidatus Aenigmatarchaeota archaeon]